MNIRAKFSSYEKKILDKIGNPKPKSTIFPYAYYDRDNQIFINDKSIGFVLKVIPFVGIDDAFLKQLSALVDNELASKSCLQFLLDSGTDISEVTDRWLDSYNDSDHILKNLASKRVEYIKSLTKGGISNYRLKNYSLYIIYSISLKYSKSNIDLLKKQRIKLEELFINNRKVEANEFIKFVSNIVAPNSDTYKYNENALLSNQIAVGCPLFIGDESINHNNEYISRFYEIEDTPSENSINNIINLLGDAERDNLQIPGRLILSYTIRFDIDDKNQAFLTDKGNSLIKLAGSFLTKFDLKLNEEIAEWQKAFPILNQGKRLVTTSWQIMLTAQKKDFDNTEQAMTSLYSTIDFKVKPIRAFTLPSLLSLLPFGYTNVANIIKFFNLAKTTVSEEILGSLPIHAEWKGNATGGMLFAGRRGQLAVWNPWYGESNYNVKIIAQPGGGKSVYIQDLITNLLAEGARVFVLDIGRSYQKLCSLLGGEFIEFDDKSNIVLNPFTHTSHSTEKELKRFLSLLTPIIAKMAAPKGGTTDIEDSLISEAVRHSWDSFGVDTEIEDIANFLESRDTIQAKNLSTMLFQYSKKGPYGNFFSGKANVNFKNRFTVVEFEELREQRDLLAVIMQMVTVQILTQVFTGNRTQKIAIIIDEAWLCLELFPNYLEELSRTTRKYNCSLILATQNVTDFYNTNSAKVVYSNCPWTIMLKQNEKSYTIQNESGKEVKLYDGDKHYLIQSLNTIPGRYSESLLMSSSGNVVLRLILDPFSRILYSTSPKEFSAVQNLIKSGLNVTDAVNTVAKDIYGEY